MKKTLAAMLFQNKNDLTINSDCTGEPPGELMLRKTASSFLGRKALLINGSNESILRGCWRPNLQGVPIKLRFSNKHAIFLLFLKYYYQKIS